MTLKCACGTVAKRHRFALEKVNGRRWDDAYAAHTKRAAGMHLIAFHRSISTLPHPIAVDLKTPNGIAA